MKHGPVTKTLPQNAEPGEDLVEADALAGLVIGHLLE